jgi:hypothetical protein
LVGWQDNELFFAVAESRPKYRRIFRPDFFLVVHAPRGGVLSRRALSPKNRNPFQCFPVIALATALSER